MAIIEYGDSVLLFTTDSLQPFAAPAQGMQMWRSSDGVAWETVGTVIEAPNRITAVTVAKDRLVAVGKTQDGEPTMWRSLDGSTWMPQQLPTEKSATATPVLPTRVASSGDLIVVTGVVDLPVPRPSVYKAYFDLTGIDPTSTGSDVYVDTSSMTFNLRGPFGLTVFSASAEQLGLSPESTALDTTVSTAFVATIWSLADSGDWHVETIENAYHTDITNASDGRIDVSTFDGSGGQHVLSSTDGVTWERSSRPAGQNFLPVRWGSRLVEISGDGSIAVVTGSLGNPSSSLSEPALAILVKDGYTLTAGGPIDSDLVLSQGDTTLARIPTYSNTTAGYVADAAAGTISILDPDTGSPYVTFALDELRQLESARNSTLGPPKGRSLLLFSTDAHTWSINDVSEIAGGDTAVAQLQITTRGLIAAISKHPYGLTTATEPPTVQIFVGEIPN